jgi:hypothetical protein
METEINNTEIEETTTETVETVVDQDVYTEKEQKVLKALHTRSEIADLEKMITDTVSKRKQMSLTDDEVDITFIDERVKELTLEQIKAMSNDEIKAICTNDDGDVVITLEDDQMSDAFRRDYVVMVKETTTALDGMQEEIEKIKVEFDKYDEEIKEITAGFDDLNGYMLSVLDRRIEAAPTEEAKERYIDIKRHMNMALTLDNVIEYYSNDYRARTAVANVKAPKSGKKVIKQYETVLTSIGSKTDFRRFGGIQLKCLPDEYKNRTEDCFMYSIVNYIASWHKNEDNLLNAVFLSQFAVNLKNLIFNNFSKSEDRETFINAICKVIDLID